MSHDHDRPSLGLSLSKLGRYWQLYNNTYANIHFGIKLGLVTENVHQVIEKALELGAIIVKKPKEKPWGQTVGYIQDLDGFLLEICTPMNA